MATILVVDDLPANRQVLVALLRFHGHHLVEAKDGREALAAVKVEHPDLVITDVLMPVMDGYTFVKQLRLDPQTSATPVVFYTAHYGEREAKALALSSGVAYVLTKPAESGEVLAIVDCALAGQSDTGTAAHASLLTREFDREHLRLITDKLSENVGELTAANARLRALINIGLELASDRDPDRLLQQVSVAARDLFGATYVSLAILHSNAGTVRRLVTSGAAPPDWIKEGDSISGMLESVVANRQAVRGESSGVPPITVQLPFLFPRRQSFLIVPIAAHDHVFGWMALIRSDAGSFTEEDEQLTLALAGQVGRLYESYDFWATAQRQNDELER